MWKGKEMEGEVIQRREKKKKKNEKKKRIGGSVFLSVYCQYQRQ